MIDNAGNVGQFSSIKIDSRGTVHINYYDVSNGALKYASVTGDATDITIIDRNGAGQWTSVGLDSSDLPRISYYDNTMKNLKYAWATAE